MHPVTKLINASRCTLHVYSVDTHLCIHYTICTQGHLMTADDRTGMVFEVVKNADETYHVAPKHVSKHYYQCTFHIAWLALLDTVHSKVHINPYAGVVSNHSNC
jgi:uncharacterized lipoprotein NlpE involved in copper resistance